MSASAASWNEQHTRSRSWICDADEQEVARRREEMAYRSRWAARGRARVVHPTHGEVIVPCASKYAAILCAADVWKCDSSEIMDAEVWRYGG